MKLFNKAICLLIITVVMISVVVLPVGAVSTVPYKGYTYNQDGVDIDAPVGYVPDKTYFYNDLGVKDAFFKLNDIFVYNDEYVYVADSHKGSMIEGDDTPDRVVVLDENYQFVKQYTEFVDKKTGTKYPLTNPVGVYVTDDEIFVCCDIQVQGTSPYADKAAAAAADDEEDEEEETDGEQTEETETVETDSYYDGYCVVADHKGNVTRVFTNPIATSLLVDNVNFRPYNVIEDKSGYIYIRCQDLLEGLMVFSPEGEFLQYYGTNQVTVTFQVMMQQMWKKIFSRAAADTLEKAVPTELSSIFVDQEGFIYTTTSTTAIEENLRLRKLNAAGDNIMKYDSTASIDLCYADRFTTHHRDSWKPRLVDVYVDKTDVVAALDQNYGRVFLYDQQSTLLTVFGYREENLLVRNGTTSLPVSISKLGDKYIILDQGQNALVTYKPTAYMEKLLLADDYYMRGWYVDGQEYWEEVLKYDANNVRAYAAIGKSLLEQEKYEESLEYLKKGYDRTSYSTAYAEYRREYIRANYWWMIPLAALGVVAVVYIFKLIRKLLGFKDVKKRIKFN